MRKGKTPETKTGRKPALQSTTTFPIVAIGASSGGLEAVTELLKNLSPKTGMAFVYFQHSDPNRKSALAAILSRVTKMQVQEMAEWEKIAPGNFYTFPPDKEIKVLKGKIKLSPRKKIHTRTSVDGIFSSIAEVYKENVVGIVLSGNASDGALGLKAIRHSGGITFAQDDSAQFNSMPQSAIAEGVVDFVLSPKKIAQKLNLLSEHDFIKPKHPLKIRKDIIGNKESAGGGAEPDLSAILHLIYKINGVDFSGYKMNTIKRRILRRMIMHKFTTLKQYEKFLHKEPSEVSLLCNDLLINVTDFFRDPEAFRYLKTVLFPKLIKNKKRGESLRIWVAGCSTGQEAYSVAILLLEILGNSYSEKQIQIFATDLSEQAIKRARDGIYSKHELKSVSSRQLELFFTKFNGGYRVNKSLRDMCAFATHNILSDPPFSKIDFVSCCNMLIYFNSISQKRALSILHYALNEGGYLMLGKSESTGTSSSLFTPVSKRFKIYSRKKGTGILPRLLSRYVHPVLPGKKNGSAEKKVLRTEPAGLENIINSIFLSEYAPASAVINRDLTLLQFKGKISDYLHLSEGKATLNILKMASPEIAFSLRTAIHKAIATNHPFRQEGIEIKNHTVLRLISLDIRPLNIAGEEPLFLVIFSERQQVEAEENKFESEKGNIAQKAHRIKKLEHELSALRLELLALTAEHEKAIEELQATNEEVVSANEELQGMNEELETSKEEIESTNEEINTTNQELQTRNDQLAEAYDFSENIIATLHEPILILDKNFQIKSANKAFYKKFMVLQSDIDGKSLFELGSHQWDVPRLHELLETIIPKKSFIHNFEVSHVFPDIGKKIFLLNARLIIQKTKQEQLILLAFTDITEKTRKQKTEKRELEDIINEKISALQHSYDELDAKKSALEKMNKELETFTFVSSHDLQEPLRKIKTFAGMLLSEENKNLSLSGKDYLQRMQETVLRMQKLLEDLLTYSRIKNAERKFEITDLTHIVQDVIADFREAIKEKKAVIKTSTLCRTGIIRFQFRQLIQNLISNALKFSHPKRNPRIVLKSKIISGKITGLDYLIPTMNYCHITVSDNGIGFDPQYKDRIFEVFQRLHDFDEYKGTGIGLAICKRIVENHNGIIKANGHPNKGAQFDIYLPIN